MEFTEKYFWEEVVKELFENRKYKNVHKWYSSSKGWAYLSYKGERRYVDYTCSYTTIENILNAFK